MNTYHKIENVWGRDDVTHKLIEGKWRLPIFEYLKDNLWSFTEKVDGMNVRVIWHEGKVTFAGKTDNAQMPPQLIARLTEIFGDGGSLGEVGGQLSVCLYGEGYGAGIQKAGASYSPRKDFVLFDVKIGDRWMPRNDALGIADLLGVHLVPEVHIGTLVDGIELVRCGFESHWENAKPEGLVGRPIVEMKDEHGNRVITKIKGRDF